jgi:hypothetical protein
MNRRAHLTPQHQSNAGRARASAAGFFTHNRAISPDGPAAQSAYMRARKGSALLDPWHVEFLFLADMKKGIEQGEALREDDQRLLFGWYVWSAIWGNLNAPARPTADEFLANAARARAVVDRGLALADPLEVIYVAPDDFCNCRGEPLRRAKQRKAFRAAMARAREAAEAWNAEVARQQHSSATGRQKSPLVTSRPAFITNARLPKAKYRHRRRVV